MTESYEAIDASIFEESERLRFDLAIVTESEKFVEAKKVIDEYLYETDSATQAAAKREFEESPDAQKLTGTIGELFSGLNAEEGQVVHLEISSATPIPTSSREQYEEALASRDESTNLLVSYIFGYQRYMSEKIVGIYTDPLEANEKSWEFAWKRLQNTLQPIGGVMLAEVLIFFDKLIELKYPKTFDPTDSLRGLEARNDVAARTFYTVLENHLSRAIRRPGEDGWTL